MCAKSALFGSPASATSPPATSVTVAGAFGGGAVVGRGVSTKLPLGVEIGAHVCDVEVDTGTGQVTVLRYTAFQDVGLALNPAAVEGQIEGSVVQGLGWALMEGYDYGPDGRIPARVDIRKLRSFSA